MGEPMVEEVTDNSEGRQDLLAEIGEAVRRNQMWRMRGDCHLRLRGRTPAPLYRLCAPAYSLGKQNSHWGGKPPSGAETRL